MNKINSFSIQKVKLRGFKCFADETEYDFGDMTFISGANALGKSSIADAIAFAFVGTPFFGDKGLDRLHNPNSPELEVSVTFTDEKGAAHNITRYRKNDTTQAVFDCVNVRQTDLNEIFDDRDLFLSMLNPLYFIEVLGDKGKELLEKLLPFVSHDDVLAGLSDSTRKTLAGEKMFLPEVYLKNKREEIRDCEKNLLYLQGQQDLLSDQQKAARDSLKQTDSELSGINGGISALETERDASRSLPETEARLTELNAFFEKMADTKSDTSEADAITDAIREAEINREKVRITEYASAHTQAISDINAAIKALYDEYQTLSDSLGNVRPGFTCPACFHEVTDDNIETVRADIQRRIKKCVSDGKKAKADLAALKETDKTDKDVFEDQRSAALSAHDASLCEQRGKLAAALEKQKRADDARYEAIAAAYNENQLLERKREHGSLTDEQISRLATLRERKRELELQSAALKETLSQPDFSERIKAHEAEIGRLKQLISAAFLYVGKKNELLFGSLKMNRASVSLSEVVKSSGEIKDTFKFTFDGRDYKRLSLSEKIRAGLELAELIKRLSGRNYPTFIDNGESVPVIDNVRPGGQMIFSVVVKGRPLTVTYKNRGEDLKKAS